MQKITHDQELKLDPVYHQIMEIMDLLSKTGALERSYGYCLSMCDMIQTLLLQKGIKSRMVEAKLTVTSVDPPFMQQLGAEGVNHDDVMDTHIILITETATPILIDASIGKITRGFQPYIVERVNGRDLDVLGDYQIDHVRWFYLSKGTNRVPKLHQTSILDRVATDLKVKRDISLLKVLIILAIVISSLNAIRGTYDFYQVYMVEKNNWGPEALEELQTKIERLEQTVRKPIDQR